MLGKITRAVVVAFVAIGALAGCQSATAPNAVDPDSFSAEEYQDAAWRSIMSGYPEAERPAVQAVRVIGNEDFPAVFTACMSDEGFDVAVNEDTSFEATVPPSQDEAFSLANYVCEATYPRPLILAHPDDDESGRALYAYYRDELIPCLVGLGYTPDELPSEQTFLQQLNTAQRFDPYAALISAGGGLDIDSWDAANEQCPQRPSSLGG